MFLVVGKQEYELFRRFSDETSRVEVYSLFLEVTFHEWLVVQHRGPKFSQVEKSTQGAVMNRVLCRKARIEGIRKLLRQKSGRVSV